MLLVFLVYILQIRIDLYIVIIVCDDIKFLIVIINTQYGGVVRRLVG